MANELAIQLYNNGYNTRPPTLLNSIFMTTVNTAAKTLVAVASNAKTEQAEKWKASDHMRFMLMLMTWLAVWVLRVLMDHNPFSNSYQLLEGVSHIGSFEHLLSSSSSSSSSSSLSSALSSLTSASSSATSMDLVISEGSESASVKALGRALTNILGLLNEIPASSRKYHFAVAMADKIVEENARDGHVELLQINRTALASAFARTSGLLYLSLRQSQTTDESGSWSSRIVRALPLGSYVIPVLKGLGRRLFPGLSTATCLFQNKRELAKAGGERTDDLAAEKHAQELLWITNKMVGCGAVDEALVQWSLATGLASQTLTANPRLQGFILKITATLFGEALRAKYDVTPQVKYRLLAVWIPVFCYAENGLAYPVMTGYEKAELERTMDVLISSLTAIDQEVILTSWLQDFTVSASDWPNLQISYDRWCHSARKQII